jgi:cytochrome P450
MPTQLADLDLPTLDVMGLPRQEAQEVISQLAKEHWIAKSEIGYSVLRYDEGVSLLRERRFFNGVRLLRELNGIPEDDETVGPARRESILTMEGEGHTRLRRLVAPAFTPAATASHRPKMRAVVQELLKPHLQSTSLELVSAICEPYPIPIICEVLGAQEKDWELFSSWATDIFKIFNQNLAEDLPAINAAGEALSAYIADLVAERRLSPREDLLSALIAAEEDGDRLSTDELCMLAEAVLMAGTDTTRNQLGCTMALFAENPDQWALFRSRPDLAPRAVEESMRYLGAVRGTLRYASEELIFNDIVFPQGSIVSISLAGANRDPEIFQAPDDFNLLAERQSGHLTFGSGIHHCLGAALARAELQEALLVLAEEFETVELAGTVEWKPPTFGIWGPSKLPLAFTRSEGGGTIQ